MEHSPNKEPADDADARTEDNSTSTVSRSALRTTGIVVSVCTLTAAAVVGITQLPEIVNNDESSTAGTSDEASSSKISDSAFLLRNGKFDCSTMFDQASLSQLAESGLAYAARFVPAEDRPKPGSDGRLACTLETRIEHAPAAESAEAESAGAMDPPRSEGALEELDTLSHLAENGLSGYLHVPYFLMSIPEACDGLAEGAEPDQFGWVHERKLDDPEGEVVAIGSAISNDQHGCLAVVGTRDQAKTTEGVDAEIAASAREIAESIAPVLDKSVKAEGSAPFSDAPVTPSFLRDGHYDCRAYLESTTAHQAEEIGLTTGILPGASSEELEVRHPQEQPPAIPEKTEQSDDGLAQCSVTKDSHEVEILTSADPDNAICTVYTGVPLKSDPAWSYFVDLRPAQNPVSGHDQGSVSMNVLHTDADKGCIIVRSYGIGGTASSPTERLAELAPIAASISALEESTK